MPELFAWKKDDFTGDLWDFTIVSGGDIEDQERIYSFLRSIRFSATSDGFGRMLVYFQLTENDLRPIMQIRNLCDRQGTEIIPDGIWQMTEFEPVLDMFNKVHAYRTRLALIQDDE